MSDKTNIAAAEYLEAALKGEASPEMLIRAAVPLLDRVLRMWFGVSDEERRMCRAMRDALLGADGVQIATMIARCYNPYGAAADPRRASAAGSDRPEGAVAMCMFVPGGGGVNCRVAGDAGDPGDVGEVFFVDFDGRGGVKTQATLDGRPLTDLSEFLAHAATHTLKATAERVPGDDHSVTEAAFTTTTTTTGGRCGNS